MRLGSFKDESYVDQVCLDLMHKHKGQSMANAGSRTYDADT